MKKRGFLAKLLLATTYALPVAFLIISYFLITVSGEDLYQGAATHQGAWADALRVFSVNGRLSDMYAWFAIKLVDYQFNFGWDTIIRVVDLAMGCGILYLIVRLALGRRPRLRLGDALLWNAAAIMLFATPFGRVLYVGFSLIHNYTIILLAPLLFLWPFYRRMRGGKRAWDWLLAIVMLVGGVAFGISSNLVPLAVLGTLLVLAIWDKIRRRKIEWRKWLQLWRVTGILGAIVGICLSFFVGGGVSGYANGGYAESYDYVPFGEIFGNLSKIWAHEVSNFGRLLMPIALVLAALLVFHVILRVVGVADRAKLTWRARRVISFATIFAIVYTLMMSQINYPYRLASPAYVAGVIVVLTIFAAVLRSMREAKWLSWVVVTLPIVGVSAALMVIHGVWQINYRREMAEVLSIIREVPLEGQCVSRERVKTKTSPSAFLTQEDMLTDWVMPVRIYDKTVSFCD